MVLPGAAFTEKTATYANLEGRAQQTLAAITPPYASREDWKIVRAVSEVANHTLPYETLIQVRQRMAQISPNLINYHKLIRNQPNVKSPLTTSIKTSNGSIKVNPKMHNLLDYFQTDVISRASQVMAKCVSSYKKEIDKRESKAKADSKY